jgi:hypothetical protein
MSQQSTETKVTVTVDGAIIMIAPVTLSFANQFLMRFEGCELHATFGVDSNTVLDTPSDELGCLSFSFDNSLTVSLDTLNQFLGITLPVGVTVGQYVSVSKDLFVLMILKCITEPKNAYRLNLMSNLPRFLVVENQEYHRGRFGTNGRITMNPADFIRKHITAALTAEGFAPSVVQGVARHWNITAACLSRPRRELFCRLPFSGSAMGSWADNHRRAESGKEKAGKRWWHFSRPVLTSLRISLKSTWRGKFMKNHIRTFDYKSSAGDYETL